MKVRQLICVVCAALLVMPVLANAEVYKWRDTNGVVRYSDTPPPSNVKQEQVGYKKLKTPTGTAAPLSPVAPSDKVKSAASAGSKEEAKKEGASKEGDNQDAKKRQETAEADKKAKEDKEKNEKIKEENCKVAKTNLAGFKQGGRLFKVDEKGQRHYMDDKELKEGAEKAQRDIDENCN